MKRSLAFALGSILLISAAVACERQAGDGSAAGSSEDLTSAPTSSHDPALVGQWTTDGADALLFHSLSLSKDGTFSAMGGCAPAANGGEVHCFAIVLINGTWKTGVSGGPPGPADRQVLTLVDQSGQTTTLFYGVSGDTLTVSRDSSAAKSVFKKQPDHRVAAGKACNPGDECVDGFECRSNCPIGAECIIQLNVCQPKATSLKQGAVCGPTTGTPTAPCAAGLVCKTNCPSGAACIIEIETCQPK
jgi:hypothetical protein